jgi:hypothetical protein
MFFLFFIRGYRVFVNKRRALGTGFEGSVEWWEKQLGGECKVNELLHVSRETYNHSFI